MRPLLNGGTLGRLKIHSLSADRRAAARFWERRRIVYNLALLPPAVLGYLPRAAISFGVGDAPRITDAAVLSVFVAYALAANVCYTLAYVLEFFLGSDLADSTWIRWGRTATFVSGTLFAMIAALFAAFGIAQAQFPD